VGGEQKSKITPETRTKDFGEGRTSFGKKKNGGGSWPLLSKAWKGWVGEGECCGGGEGASNVTIARAAWKAGTRLVQEGDWGVYARERLPQGAKLRELRKMTKTLAVWKKRGAFFKGGNAGARDGVGGLGKGTETEKKCPREGGGW